MDFPSACFDEFEGGPSLAAAAIWATGACVPEAGLAAAARAASCGATPRSIASASTVASAASSSAPLDSVRSTTRLSVPGCSFAQARFDALHLDGASRRQRRASAAAAARQEEARGLAEGRGQNRVRRAWRPSWAEAQLQEHTRRSRERQTQRVFEASRRQEEALRACSFTPRILSQSAEAKRLARLRLLLSDLASQQRRCISRLEEVPQAAEKEAEVAADESDDDCCPRPRLRWCLQVSPDAALAGPTVAKDALAHSQGGTRGEAEEEEDLGDEVAACPPGVRDEACMQILRELLAAEKEARIALREANIRCSMAAVWAEFGFDLTAASRLLALARKGRLRGT